MVNCERIAAEAAELAREFWLEIEAGFRQQAAHCWAGRPTRAGIPCDPACAANHDLSHGAADPVAVNVRRNPCTVFDHNML